MSDAEDRARWAYEISERSMSDAPLMIVADTYKAAQLYAREHELGPEGSAWRYVYDPRQVQGYRGGQWVRIRTGDRLSFAQLRGRLDAMEILMMAGFTHVEDEE
jgi:hypothetical protein